MSSLYPTIDNTFDLGNQTFRWNDLNLGGNALIEGNLGIGTTSPGAKLDLLATDAAPGTNMIISQFRRSVTNGGGSSIIQLMGSSIGDALELQQNAGATGPFQYGSTYLDSNIRNTYTTDSGPYGNINFIVGNTNAMTIGGGTQSGNVGIGTTTPQNTLNVIGDGNFTGNLYSNNH